jgi:hypothetical protein
MKDIQTAIFSIASAGLLYVGIAGSFLTPVRAEAPQPARSGCWSREIVMRPMQDPQTTTKIEGRVVAIEQNNSPWLAPKEIATWARVQTTTGEQRSIYLGSSRLLKQQNFKLAVRDNVAIEGLPMPNAKQPTIVAKTLVKGNRTWKIDNYTDLQRAAKSCKYTG